MASNFPITIYGGRESTYPDVRYFPVTAGQTFIFGALVYLTSDAVSECGADPSLILGIALSSAANKTLYPNSEIPVAILTPEVLVLMGSSTTPAVTHRLDEYGIVKSTNWLVDVSEGSAVRVKIVDYSPHSGNAGQEWFICRFLAEFLQGDGIAS